jgi:hypothetical protein
VGATPSPAPSASASASAGGDDASEYSDDEEVDPVEKFLNEDRPNIDTLGQRNIIAAAIAGNKLAQKAIIDLFRFVGRKNMDGQKLNFEKGITIRGTYYLIRDLTNLIPTHSPTMEDRKPAPFFEKIGEGFVFTKVGICACYDMLHNPNVRTERNALIDILTGTTPIEHYRPAPKNYLTA